MLYLIGALRKLPHSWAFDEHLTRCVAARIFYDERLTVAKVFGWQPLDMSVYLDCEPITEEDIRRSDGCVCEVAGMVVR
jgi:hypothetical protein